MAQRRRGPIRTVVTPLVVASVLILGLRGNLDSALDRLSGADAPPDPVAVIQEGATSNAETPRSWTLDVPAGQMLVVDARAVELVREDEGSRIDNTSPDRILLAAEGGHP